jgi:predicted nucleic acid-binding protein
MKIVVDANIIFSAILNSNGKIGDLLINSNKHFKFIAPQFLRHEISKHHTRLCRISELTSDQVREAEFHIYQDITFISEEQIKQSSWKAAYKLVSDIDPNDTPYIAFAKHFRCKVWSGDQKLHRGLQKKEVHLVITTDELYAIRQRKNKQKGP